MARSNYPAILIVQMFLMHLITPAINSDTTMSSSECVQEEQEVKNSYDEVKHMAPSGDKTLYLSPICKFINDCSQNGDPPSGFSEILQDCPRVTCIGECHADIAKDVNHEETFENEEEESAYYCPKFQVQAMTDCLKGCPSPQDALPEYKSVLEVWGCKNVKLAGEDEVMGGAEMTEPSGVTETYGVAGSVGVAKTAVVTGTPKAMGGSGMNLMPVAVSAWLALGLVLRNQV